MYHIKLTSKAKKEFKRIPKRYQKAIAIAFEDLKEDPFLGKPLARELAGRYSYKVGVYRIIYKIDAREKKVYIITAGHRATVYE